MRRSRVYVVQEPLKKDQSGAVVPRIDLTPAEKFGEIVFLLSWTDPKKMTPDQCIGKIRRGLSDYNQSDYMVFVGSPTVMWAAGAIASEMSGGVVRTLEWDNRTSSYNVIVADLNAQPE